MPVTLDEAPAGSLLTVASTHGPSAAVTRRLAELGVRAGSLITVQARTSGRGAILGIGDDRIAVSRTILRSVHVVAPA